MRVPKPFGHTGSNTPVTLQPQAGRAAGLGLPSDLGRPCNQAVPRRQTQAITLKVMNLLQPFLGVDYNCRVDWKP
jgi:hypothetical protein